MQWNQYTIKTITQAEDILSATLADIGVEGVQIEDNIPLSQEDKEKMFIDILPELPADDGVAYVSFFLDAAQDNTKLLAQVQQELDSLKQFMDIGEVTIKKTTTKDSDWVNNWKEFFKPFSVGEFYIKPTWEPATEEADGKRIIEIDPGTSFGTGKHETTQLCIRQLDKYVKIGSRVLDVGCGSGILSIVAAKMGAGQVFGIDVDPHAVEASIENIQVNEIPDRQCRFTTGNIIEDKALQQEAGTECYDVVVANILAEIIIPLTPVIPKRLKRGGIYITSGILNTKEAAVVQAIQNSGLEVIEVTTQGDWVSVTAIKK